MHTKTALQYKHQKPAFESQCRQADDREQAEDQFLSTESAMKRSSNAISPAVKQTTKYQATSSAAAATDAARLASRTAETDLRERLENARLNALQETFQRRTETADSVKVKDSGTNSHLPQDVKPLNPAVEAQQAAANLDNQRTDNGGLGLPPKQPTLSPGDDSRAALAKIHKRIKELETLQKLEALKRATGRFNAKGKANKKPAPLDLDNRVSISLSFGFCPSTYGCVLCKMRRLTQIKCDQSSKYQPDVKPPPLSNDAIASILRHCKQNDPKAQAWIKAHELGESDDPADLDKAKTIIETLKNAKNHQGKGSQKEKTADNSRREFKKPYPPVKGDSQETDDTNVTQRVWAAHDRLQNALFGNNRPTKIAWK